MRFNILAQHCPLAFHVDALFPRLFIGAERSTRRIGGGELIESEPLAECGGGSHREASGIGQFTSVKAKRLFIKVAKQVERLYRYVGAFQGTLQETPEVL